MIAALALGCLHGESHRTEQCFSNRMPRTISTKPAYSVHWWRERAKPVTRQGKDDRHRRIEAYWQFLREAWKGVVPLLQNSAQVVVRIGGTRLGQDELQAGLLESLNSTGRKFELAESRQTLIKNGQRRIFQAATDKASVEHDFRFRLA